MTSQLASDCYQLKWHSFSSHLHASIATLMTSDCYADTILCTHDGGQIKAHRFILSVCSNYFQSVFKTQAKLVVSFPIFVMMPTEIDYKTLKFLVHYIYCGETTVSNDILEKVLKAGDLLKIRGLWRPKDRNTPPPLIHKKTTEDISPGQDTRKPTSGLKVLTANEIQAKAEGSRAEIGAARKTVVINTSAEDARNFDGIKAFSILKPKSMDNGRETPKDGAERPVMKRKLVVLEASKEDQGDVSMTMTSTRTAGSEKSDKKHPTRESIPSSSSVVASVAPLTGSSDDISEDGNLFIKDEPKDWDIDGKDDFHDEDLLHTELTIKPEEINFPMDDDDYGSQDGLVDEDNQYPPLSCELCAESFEVPTDWLKHIGKHSDLHQPAKRQRRGIAPIMDQEEPKLPPLLCDLCQKSFPTPAEWVRHIQQTHTERELAIVNNSAPPKKPIRACTAGINQKVCTTCDKKFPSHASMVIHSRTHTGERPFLCTFCNKGFNVKSNLLRHLRTLHDRIINPVDVHDRDESQSST